MSYVNPFKNLSGIIPERIDMGVDYACSQDSPLLALGNGTIWLARVNFDTGWPGPNNGPGGFVGLQLSSGAYAGKHVFYAENITPLVVTGQTVHAGQPIATLHAAFPNCEVGWGTGSWTGTMARAFGQQASPDPGGWVSGFGASFATLCVALGAPKPIKWGDPVHYGPTGKMPPGFPPIWNMAPIQVFPLVVGSTGVKVHQAQRGLQARGHGIAADGMFGPATQGAVNVWQRDHKRTVTGRIEHPDWEFMFPLLHPGTNSAWPGATTALQNAYNHLTSPIRVATDGNYGPGMVYATKVFQTRQHLHPDGMVGPMTWHRLFQ